MLDAQCERRPLSFVLIGRTLLYASSMALHLSGPHCHNVQGRAPVVKVKIPTMYLGIRRAVSIGMKIIAGYVDNYYPSKEGCVSCTASSPRSSLVNRFRDERRRFGSPLIADSCGQC